MVSNSLLIITTKALLIRIITIIKKKAAHINKIILMTMKMKMIMKNLKRAIIDRISQIKQIGNVFNKKL